MAIIDETDRRDAGNRGSEDSAEGRKMKADDSAGDWAPVHILDPLVFDLSPDKPLERLGKADISAPLTL
jgi:hypothetical protein